MEAQNKEQPKVPAAMEEEPSQAQEDGGEWQVARYVRRYSGQAATSASDSDVTAESGFTYRRPIGPMTEAQAMGATIKKQRKREARRRRRRAAEPGHTGGRTAIPPSETSRGHWRGEAWRGRRERRPEGTGRSILLRTLSPIREATDSSGSESSGQALARQTYPRRNEKRRRPFVESPPTKGSSRQPPKKVRGDGGGRPPAGGPRGGAEQVSRGGPSYRDALTTPRELQVAMMGDPSGGELSQEQADELRRLLIAELRRRMEAGEDRGEERPCFINSGRQADTGWFLVSCHDVYTRNWLLAWRPATEVPYHAVRMDLAPRPAIVAVCARFDPAEPAEVVNLLSYQNARLGVSQWRLLGRYGTPGNWRFHFRVPQEALRTLDSAGWRLFYELVTLPVWRVGRGGAEGVGGEEEVIQPPPAPHPSVEPQQQ